MITPEIISYINWQRENNTPDETIRSTLISNGWKEGDVNEAFSKILEQNKNGIITPEVSTKETKQARNKRVWIIFGTLCLVDFIMIMILGGRGLFGISPLSIIIRLVVIYGIASFSTIGLKKRKTTFVTVVESIARIIGALIIVFIIIIGIFFAWCFFNPPNF